MTEAEFTAYLDGAVKTYADEKVRAGNWQPEEALGRSERDFRTLLPEGLASKNHYLFSIKDSNTDQTVGMIWFGVVQPGRSAFVYDFSVDKAFQGKGYGKGAMLELEEKVRALGITSLSLHVFGHNRVARSLYEKLGYEVTNVNMTKRIGAPNTEQ